MLSAVRKMTPGYCSYSILQPPLVVEDVTEKAGPKVAGTIEQRALMSPPDSRRMVTIGELCPPHGSLEYWNADQLSDSFMMGFVAYWKRITVSAQVLQEALAGVKIPRNGDQFLARLKSEISSDMTSLRIYQIIKMPPQSDGELSALWSRWPDYDVHITNRKGNTFSLGVVEREGEFQILQIDRFVE
ncbi:MAG: hypothetical protein HY255_09465 [Betaproteobacteria bacterium]|nr:hypothetical protein [Betaproteobacteria bacterium]